MHPKVSIIISTYNGAAYIGETIESIRSQTYSDWELIIVDDGSTDDTERRLLWALTMNEYNLLGRKIGINGKVKNIGLGKSFRRVDCFY